MFWDHFGPYFSNVISFAGLLIVIWQLRLNNRQRQVQSLVQIYDVNRQLLTLGFSHPELFKIMADDNDADPVLERRYLQLWLNQFAQIHSYMYESISKRELRDSLTRDIAEFFTMENMRRHWRHHGSFYPVSFQKFVNDIIRKNEPPVGAAHVDSGI